MLTILTRLAWWVQPSLQLSETKDIKCLTPRQHENLHCTALRDLNRFISFMPVAKFRTHRPFRHRLYLDTAPHNLNNCSLKDVRERRNPGDVEVI